MIIRFSSLGDVLCTTPLLRALKNQNPDIEIDFLVKKRFEPAIKFNPFINKIFLWEEAANSVPRNDYGLIIDLQNNFRSRKYLANVKSRIDRFEKKSLQKFLLVNFKINLLKEAKQIPLRYASTISLDLDSEGLDFFFPQNVSLPEKDKKLIGFCPGSRHFTKRYPAEYFIQLGKILNDNGFEVALIGGNDDKIVCEKIAMEIGSPRNFCSEDNLFETAASIKKCSLIVCNDSGLMHLASALDVPIVAIFGSTVEAFGFFPYNCRSIVMENKNLNCRPCSHIGKDRCPKNHFNCMKEISPRSVYENIVSLIKNVND